jgi:hypothetical protein
MLIETSPKQNNRAMTPDASPSQQSIDRFYLSNQPRLLGFADQASEDMITFAGKSTATRV